MRLSLVLVALVVIGCAHKPSEKKVSYSPLISFQAEGKSFESEVKLPKKFDGKIPLVVIVHEWWGRNEFMQDRVEKLTAAGYATLAVDLYGEGVVVETPAEAQALATPFYQNPQLGIERLNRYIAAAKLDPHVDPSKVYVIGFCFGGTQALNFARSGAEVAGVVSFHGGLASGLPQQPIKARVLALNGLADPMVPAKERAAFEKEMKSTKANYKVVNYPQATHAFTNPKATEVGKKYKIPVAYNAKAAEAAWSEMLKFIQ